MESSIRPVTLDDVVGLDRYEVVRDEIRRRIIALKRARRVSVGPEITFVFENHDTVYFQIQEMLRAERITDLDAVRAELAVYNALLPQPGELSATMLIEITEQDQIADRLLGFLGIDEAVWLQVGADHRIAAVFEPGRSREDKLSAVQYLRFILPPAARRAFLDGAVPVQLVIDHRHYRAQTPIEGSTRASLSADLQAAA
jgi:hypothetical protein